jgi:hypothetical protein
METDRPTPPPTAPYDPLDPDQDPIPLPPDSNPEPEPVREPDQPQPITDPQPSEPTRLFSLSGHPGAICTDANKPHDRLTA